jgi:hypothetical protein
MKMARRTMMMTGLSPTTVVMPMKVMLIEIMPTRTYEGLSEDDIVRKVRAKHQFEQPSDQRDASMLFALYALANLRGESRPPPLFLVIVGPAGTGNAKDVDAVTELYRRLGIAHWLRCATMQGGIAHAHRRGHLAQPAWHGHREGSTGQRRHRERGLC